MRIINNLIANPKKLFLVDAIGALVTALTLLTIFLAFNTYFAMPEFPLLSFIWVACAYTTFSFYCYFFVGKNSSLFLKIIYLANLGYSGLIAVFVLCFHAQLTNLAIIYFVMEAIVICILASIERKAFIADQHSVDH